MAAPALSFTYKPLFNSTGTVKHQEHRLQPLHKYLNRCVPLRKLSTLRKFRFFTLSLLAICCSCNFYGDVNLGGGFRYMVEPAFNDIVKSSTYVIQDVEELGFNEDYILATTLSGDSLIYWIIDKTKKSKELAHDVDSKLKFSNVTIVDTAIWNSIRRQYNIEVKSKYDYQKEAGYNKQ